MLDNPSRQAAAILRIANQHARAGDRERAVEIAAEIDLTERFTLDAGHPERFDSRRPTTWGYTYNSGLTMNMSSYHRDVRLAQEVATAAITLAQTLRQRPEPAYAVAFDEIAHEEIVAAIARAQAAAGGAVEALNWAQKIGSNAVVAQKGDTELIQSVDRRIYALIGVAEGVLDRLDLEPGSSSVE